MTIDQGELLALLKDELANLKNQDEGLTYALNRCRKIGQKDEYDKEEDLCYEALTAKFSRLCEYLINKVFRTVENLDMEHHNRPGMLNYAEKKELIPDAEELFRMYKLRNSIVYEYDPNIISLYSSVLKEVPRLLEYVRQTISRCEGEYL